MNIYRNQALEIIWNWPTDQGKELGLKSFSNKFKIKLCFLNISWHDQNSWSYLSLIFSDLTNLSPTQVREQGAKTSWMFLIWSLLISGFFLFEAISRFIQCLHFVNYSLKLDEEFKLKLWTCITLWIWG